MKTKSLFLALLFGATIFVSCTPENVNDGQIDQQIDRYQKPLQNG
ncbi:MAG: hypothetical protein P8I32_03130 [Flavobacteriaceae bacterium]|nr:hypothetical protein [Flavobacteriaceae bacterium]